MLFFFFFFFIKNKKQGLGGSSFAEYPQKCLGRSVRDLMVASEKMLRGKTSFLVVDQDWRGKAAGGGGEESETASNALGFDWAAL